MMGRLINSTIQLVQFFTNSYRNRIVVDKDNRAIFYKIQFWEQVLVHWKISKPSVSKNNVNSGQRS